MKGLAVEIEWIPYQLNPALPPEGMDRKAFRSARFGSWATAQAMDARAVEAGKKVGADFRYDRQTRTPNTLAGHTLARLARADGGAALQTEVMEALFAAYFTRGESPESHHTLLEAVAAKPEQPVADLPLLGKEERQRLLVEWNNTALPIARDR